MLIVTSDGGVVGTSDNNVNSYVEYNDISTNAEHEYLFIMERSDNDVSEGASATEPNRRTVGESVDRRRLSGSEGGGDQLPSRRRGYC